MSYQHLEIQNLHGKGKKKKKNPLDFQLLLKTWKMWLAPNSCLVKARAPGQLSPGRGVAFPFATIPVTPDPFTFACFIHEP